MLNSLVNLMKKMCFFALALSLSTVCAHGTFIEKSGFLKCFDVENLPRTESPGRYNYCETSAVSFDGSKLIFANDKPISGDHRSPVFSLALGELDAIPTYYTQSIFKNAVKYEDSAITPDGQYFIANTGFDRIKARSKDEYNTIVFWPVNNPEDVKVANPTLRGNVLSSLSLREAFQSVLHVPYYKVEGMTVISENKMLFGIRELGASDENFKYAALIIEADYKISRDALTISNLKIAYDFTDLAQTTIGKPVGLSSLEFNHFNQKLYITTSFEVGGLGAHLWVTSLDAGFAPETIFAFDHKIEGIAALSADKLFVIADDDDVDNRKKNEAYYAILDLH
ncbi:MAG: hypothetical protein A2X86_09515 [Bdellovibrionales bacterium GWA2_49_15]|nr:MAG: hypothetical protein A2X86_09515 [Bdellovibrionales bacterium GWA2_49_15]HAZ13017.1 hypothetical protein [Bdellovibrionales bacterium]